MSIFGELDVESANDDPFQIPDNTYRATVTDAKVGPTNNGDKVGLTIVYTINSDDEHDGKSVSEWKHIPTPNDPKNLTPEESKAASFLKQRMLSLGIPAERINSVTPDDLKAREVYITTKTTTSNDRIYTNVRKVVVIEDGVAFDENKKISFS